MLLLNLFTRRVLSLAFVLASALSAGAQTTTFTYQGRLTDTSMSASGTYQMQFALYDAVTGGTPVGSPIENTAVSVINGVFTVQLDFGAAAFTGPAHYLEIRVRRTSGETYSVLNPRQRVTSAPYALRAGNAAQADAALDSQRLGGVDASEYVTNVNAGNSFILNATAPQQTASFNISGNALFGGSVGVGTTAPGAKLEVRGTGVQQRITDSTSGNSLVLQGGAGDNMKVTGYNYGTGQGVPLHLSVDGGNTILNSGGGIVGIGTTNPSPFFRLDVVGHGGARSLSNSASHFVSETTGGTNSWARFYMRTLNRSWFLGTSQNFGGDQLYLVDETADQWRMTIQPNGGAIAFPLGNVGIGTTTPARKLTIRETANCCASTVRIESGGNTSISDVQFVTPGRSWAASGASSSFAIVDQTAGVNRIVITDSGNVGIGVGNPARLLHVNGRARIGAIPAEASIGSLCYNGSGDILVCGASSLQLKTNITAFDDGLKILRHLRPISFDWKDGSGHDVGLGAEDVASIEPLLTIHDAKGEVKGVKYDRLNVVFINAIKEQQAQIEAQQKQIEELKTKVSQLDALRHLVCKQNEGAAVCKDLK